MASNQCQGNELVRTYASQVHNNIYSMFSFDLTRIFLNLCREEFMARAR
jgi:hypothetical protein